MQHDIKHISFQFIVPADFFTSSVRVIKPYEITVRYALHWNKKVELEGYTVPPNMTKYIINWESLEDEMLKAAENNSKGHRVPGDWMSKRPTKEMELEMYEKWNSHE